MDEKSTGLLKDEKSKKQPILCRLGLHDWIRQKAHQPDKVWHCGEVKQCLKCGKRTKWGSARFPKHWDRMLKELTEPCLSKEDRLE